MPQAGGWLPFDRFMAAGAVRAGLGYYANSSANWLPQSGSDFVTAPEISPLVRPGAGRASGRTRWTPPAPTRSGEFGAGSGARWRRRTAGTLGDRVTRYTIVDLSGSLRAPAATLAPGERVRWVSELPEALAGVVVGNEVLDAMPVKLLRARPASGMSAAWSWHDGLVGRPAHRPAPAEVDGPHDYLTEIHPQAEALCAPGRRLRLRRQGAACSSTTASPRRSTTTRSATWAPLMCHQAHRADGNPLASLGLERHHRACQLHRYCAGGRTRAGSTLGYTTQARFLLNCGLVRLLRPIARRSAPCACWSTSMGRVVRVAVAQRRLGTAGFATGDRSHTL